MQTKPRSLSLPTVRKSTISLAHWLYHAALPPSCSCCRAPITTPHILCAECWRDLMFITQPACKRCGMMQEFDTGEFCASCLIETPHWKHFAAPFVYNHTSANLILQLKYAHRFATLPFLIRWMAEASKKLPTPDYILPVPLHPARLWLRRFNQSALLAQRIADHYQMSEKFQPLWLKRRLSAWRKQKQLSTQARIQNVAESFYLSGITPSLIGKHLWLIDDVATTGATISTLAKLLKDQGASTSILVAARVEGAFSNLG